MASCGGSRPKPGMVVRLPDEIEAAAPAKAPPGSYTVYIAHKDDNVNAVARSFKVNVTELIRINNFSSMELREGQAVYIPRKIWPSGVYRPRIRTERYFIWPLKGQMITRFGDDIGGARARYILIRADKGASVAAAKSGVVSIAYQGDEQGLPGHPNFEDWGNFIWIAHREGEATVYAHLSKTLKKEGAKVTQGDTIGMVGTSGDVSSPALRFMIYEGGLPVDPVALLP